MELIKTLAEQRMISGRWSVSRSIVGIEGRARRRRGRTRTSRTLDGRVRWASHLGRRPPHVNIILLAKHWWSLSRLVRLVVSGGLVVCVELEEVLDPFAETGYS